LVIYCTIPVARAFRELIAEKIGLEFFLYLTATLTLIAGVMAFINLRNRKLPTNAYLWLFGIVAAFMVYIYQLRDIPEEAIHVAEYGVIGILVYRALSHRTRDFSIYIMAALIVGMIGVLDEYIQWIAPSRVFDLRDIRTNFVAGSLGQLAIVAGLRPRIIAGLIAELNKLESSLLYPCLWPCAPRRGIFEYAATNRLVCLRNPIIVVSAG
jgi:VanZ family protein